MKWLILNEHRNLDCIKLSKAYKVLTLILELLLLY